MRKNEQGVALVLEIILIAIVLGGIGFAGYKVMQSKKPKPATSNTSTPPTKVSQSAKEWVAAGYAVKGTYADADIVKISDTKYRLYYSIQPEVPGNRLEVYSATTEDYKNWTQEPGTRKTMATFPEVVKLPDGKFRMYFQNAGVLKSAISSDGLAFTDETGTRIDKSDTENLSFDNVAAPTVLLKDDGTYMMVYRGSISTRYASDTPNPNTQLLMWATSPDGLTWTKKGMALDSRDSTLRGQLDGPDLVKWDDSKIHLFATTYAGVYESVFDGSKFGKMTQAFTLNKPTASPVDGPKQDVAPPGDPSLAKINGTWYMFYGGSMQENGIHFATYGSFQ